MASIIPGYEYDIFISYRHNDNKSGWVTEFVSALEEELASTIKEPISIYFDKNPHDGLLETHSVDDSLKDKLRCLIFIPIISRIYCDTKSFAWSHEFLAFLKTGAIDALGLKVKLPNGNTASRVLPIRIHELDANDKNTIETALQGVLRAIDFTFQSAGVNRPLRPKDDDAIKVAGQNSYRDQVNKTANAIGDIIAGISGSNMAGLEHNRSSAGQVQLATHNTSHPRRSWKQMFPRIDAKIAAIVGLACISLTLAFFHFSETPIITKTYKTTLLPPENTRFNASGGGNFDLSPDGNLLAFVSVDSLKNSLLWVRSLDALEAKVLAGTDGAYLPFWSPDSRYIGFFADGKLKTIDIAGGMPQTLCSANLARGGTWNKHGIIVFNPSASGPLFWISALGGKASPLTKLDTVRNEASHRWPCFLPDGRHFLYTSRITIVGPNENDAIFLASLDSTVAPKMIVKASSNIAYSNGYVLYVRQQTLMALPLDEKNFQTSGNALPLAERVFYENITSKASFSVSQNGHLVYQNGIKRFGSKLSWWSRTGKKLSSLNGDAEISLQMRLSPDGERVAISQPTAGGLTSDIWIGETTHESWARFTFDAATDNYPIWSPDGRRILFSSDRNGLFDLFQRTSNGEGSDEVLFRSRESKTPSDWSQDGQFIAYTVNYPADNNYDVWILPMRSSPPGNERKPFPFLHTNSRELRATFSPDGRWIAYQSDESGRDEIYIRPFPGPGGKWQVSIAGGTRPRWRGDGKEIFFVGTDFRIMSANVTAGVSTVQIDSVKPLFDMGYAPTGSPIRDLYDVSRDGQHFLMDSPEANEVSIPLTLVINWPEEVKKK
jgi:Tol biopolymer transport system component